jgi:hypothetical protein
MVKKNEIYHLHIAKTGGHWVSEEIVNTLRGHVKIYEQTFHNGWKPVKPTSYVISSWREPAKRTVSHYAYLIKMNRIPVEKLTAKDFILWVEKNSSYLKNYQAKNILYSGSNEYIFYTDYEFLKNEDLNEDLVIERIKSFEFFIRDNQMIASNVNKIVSKMYKYFEIPQYSAFPGSNKLRNNNEMSLKLYNQLTIFEIEELQKLNNFDYKIYNNLFLFWNGGE